MCVRILYDVHCTLYSVRRTVYDVHCTLYNVQYIVNMGSRVMDIHVRGILQTSTLYAIHSLIVHLLNKIHY